MYQNLWFCKNEIVMGFEFQTCPLYFHMFIFFSLILIFRETIASTCTHSSFAQHKINTMSQKVLHVLHLDESFFTSDVNFCKVSRVWQTLIFFLIYRSFKPVLCLRGEDAHMSCLGNRSPGQILNTGMCFFLTIHFENLSICIISENCFESVL